MQLNSVRSETLVPRLKPLQRVLLVDDAPEARLIMRRILQHAGYAVLEASTGAEALAALHTDPDIELVLLDLVLPDQDGFDVLAKASMMPKRPRICVVSAIGDDSAIDRALALDADDYLVKPIFPRDVVHKVESLLGLADDELAACELPAAVTDERGHAHMTKIVGMSQHGVELVLADDTRTLPAHLRLSSPALARALTLTGASAARAVAIGCSDLVLRVTGSRQSSAGTIVRADFVGLTETARSQLRTAATSAFGLATGASSSTLH
jgi:DNA-binding response OmpR family regulator